MTGMRLLKPFWQRNALCVAGMSICLLTVSSNAFAQTSITINHNSPASIQTYTVPAGYIRARVTAKGADGGTGTGVAEGGSGATALGVFTVAPGDIFRSVIGEAGEGNASDGGGGGGTGFCINSTLIAVGGGGGGADNTDNNNGGAQNGGNDVNNGRNGFSNTTSHPIGGSPSNIARAGEPNGTDIAAGAGGGGINGIGDSFTSNAAGGGGTATGGGQADISCATVSSGGIGVAASSIGAGADGGDGFGGGGGSWGRAGGGGGGYYGGAGAGSSGWAGGGGSFVATANPNYISGNLTAGANRSNLGTDGFVNIIIYAQPVATNDSVSGIDGTAGQTNVLNVFSGDTIGANSVTISDVILTVAAGSSVPTGLTFNTSTGNISVSSGTTPGNYSFDYQICNVDQTDICATATASVNIAVSSLPAFTCPSRFYEGVNGQLVRYDPVSEAYINVGTDQLFYNAAGYNTLDNYGYAVGREGDITNDLIRIGSDGNIEVVTENIGGGAAGDMGVDGYLYVAPRANRLRRILVTPPHTVQTLNFTGAAATVLDIAYIVEGGKEYFVGARDGRVYIWNITDLVASNFTVAGLENGGFGAVWTANDGHLYAASNNSGTIYDISNPTTAPSIVTSYNGTVSNQHDGLSCPLADPPFGLSAELTGVKSVSTFPSGQYALPGNDVVYTISVANTGDGSVDTDTVFLVDRVPDEVDVYIGDIDDAGPETDPVSFAGAGSGLSFTYATDVRFFDGATQPTDLASCNYVPMPGYDPNINFICFNPKGNFAAGDPNPSFSVNFRARIK